MRVLITGGIGAIGLAIDEAMQKKYQVTTLSRNDCDLLSIQSIEKFLSEIDFCRSSYD